MYHQKIFVVALRCATHTKNNFKFHFGHPLTCTQAFTHIGTHTDTQTHRHTPVESLDEGDNSEPISSKRLTIVSDQESVPEFFFKKLVVIDH